MIITEKHTKVQLAYPHDFQFISTNYHTITLHLKYKVKKMQYHFYFI